jgi:hypothetical protein
MWMICVCAVAFATFPSVGSGQTPDAPQHRVLLLRNGQVLFGDVTLSEDHYSVALSLGEVRVPAADVEFVCTSLLEVYLRRRAAIRFGTADEHLQVAAWCLSHGLNDEAEVEAARATALEPNNPRLAVVTHQISMIRNPPKPAPPAAKKNATSGEQLDQLVRNLPAGAVEDFTKNVQPLLVNGCSARACHGGGENGFNLMRYSRGSVAPQRLTLRNLESALKWVDADQPGSSRLLQGAIEPHGSIEAAVLSRDSAAYRHLANWVLKVTNGAVANESPKMVFASDATLSQSIAAEPVPAPDRAPAFTERVEAEPDAPPATAAREAGDGIRARDPFDPEEFNRRFHGGPR